MSSGYERGVVRGFLAYAVRSRREGVVCVSLGASSANRTVILEGVCHSLVRASKFEPSSVVIGLICVCGSLGADVVI